MCLSPTYLGYESSKIDWCESNYTVSSYIVEFLNTISNIPVLLIALWSYHQAYSKATSQIGNYEKPCKSIRLRVLRWIFIMIPIFSIYFHATLSYLGQIMDEISILIFVILLEPNGRDRLIEAGLSLFLLFTYPSLNRFMLLTYGFLTTYRYYQSHKVDKYWCYSAMTLLGLAVTFWLTDIFFCEYLSISLHWVWHLLSGLSIYCVIKIVELLSIEDTHQMDESP